MPFPDAVRICLHKYADFTGRGRRSEYWWWVLFTVLVGLVAGIIDAVLGTSTVRGNGLIGSLANLALLLPSLAVGARRLHDTGRSGWWQLLWIAIIIGWIPLIVWLCTDSHPDNQYGPSPKGAGATGATGGGPGGYGYGGTG
jgi:uncharacterized membrane protein YhaH (DUF805 family)